MTPHRPNPKCSACHGTGWAVTPDGGHGKARRCDCHLSIEERRDRELARELEALAERLEAGAEDGE